jgi:hypothetical protein
VKPPDWARSIGPWRLRGSSSVNRRREGGIYTSDDRATWEHPDGRLVHVTNRGDSWVATWERGDGNERTIGQTRFPGDAVNKAATWMAENTKPGWGSLEF